MDIDQLTAFFGWCTIVNFGWMAFVTLYIMALRTWAAGIHARMFGLNEEELPMVYFKYIAYSQVVMIPISLTPWVALKLM